MSIRQRCSCGRQLHFNEEQLGKRNRCPACGTLLAIAARAEGSPSAARQHVQAHHPEKKFQPLAESRAAHRRKRRVRRRLLPWVLGGAAAGVIFLGATVFTVVSMLRAPTPQPVVAAPQPPPAAPPEAKKPEQQPQPRPAAVPKAPQEPPKPAKPEPPKPEVARHEPAKPAKPAPPPQPQVGQDGLPKLLVWKRYFMYSNTPVLGAAFSPDGRYALCGAADGRLRLWYTQTGAEVRHFIGHAGAALAMGFSPDGKKVLSCGADKTLRLWDVATGLELRRLEGHTASAVAGVFSADGRRILSGGHDQTVRYWDAETGKELKRFEGVQGIDGRTWGVALSPDGRRALSCGRVVQLWDVATGKEVRKFEGHAGEVLAVAFSADGRRAASGGTDKTLRLWDAETGKELRKFEGHAGAVRGVAFAPDGRQLLTGSRDRTVRLWDVETGKELGRCVEPGGGIVGVAAAPEGPKTLAADAGRHFLASAADGSMRLLGMPDAPSRPLPPSSVQKRLEQPVCFSRWLVENQQHTLGQMLQELSSYGVNIEVDQKAFQAHNWNNVEGVAVRVPPLRGVKLATALRILLDQVGGPITTEGGPLFLPQVGYVIRGDTVRVTVVPPRRGPPTDESRTSLLTKKLAQVVSLPRGVREDWLASVLMYDIHEGFDLNVVIDTRSVSDVLQRKPVKLPPVDKAKLADVLQQILDQADATYVVKNEYVLVVAKRRK
jgi:hypothetical protein